MACERFTYGAQQVIGNCNEEVLAVSVFPPPTISPRASPLVVVDQLAQEKRSDHQERQGLAESELPPFALEPSN
jgi:hypothetical protein